ncbi:unnamed protein product [Prorocentrum cordatum]|uniref:C3H1-type domain-containing protein n=1 Tax=Prorocentrum cordatum TaxID=2364126 RepID=A0ABN9S7X7_9DINO|nr:unnamed protein product [Polarella glacialis]
MPLGVKASAGAPKRRHGGGRGGLSAGRSQEAMANPLYFKTTLCKFFVLGACARNEDCKFAHGQDELSALPDFTRTRLCPSVLASRACQARGCAFAHSLAELRPRVDGHHGGTEQAPDAPAPRTSSRPPSPVQGAERTAQRRSGPLPAPLRAPPRAPPRAPQRSRAHNGPRACGGPPSAEAPAPWQAGAQAQALLITEHTSGLWLSDGAMPAADAGAGKGDRAEPPSTPPSGHTAGGWSCARASRGQLCEGTRLGVECQGEAVPGPKWRLEVRNTFITIVFLGAPGSCRPFGRALSSPAAPRRR